MISIIISSYQPAFFSALEKNIAETCGVPYEIIKIDNPGKMGVCEAYNIGADRAKYEYLLFLHEDTIFHTMNWGGVIINKLQCKSIGVLGLMGSNYIPNVPFAWWELYENNFTNAIQVYGDKIKDSTIDKDTFVYALDGVFLAIRKEVHSQFLFSKKLKGYHAYDTDYSLRIASKYRNIVCKDIRLSHISNAISNLPAEWFEDLIKIRNDYHIPREQIIDKKKEIFSYLLFVKYLKITRLNFFSKLFLKYKYLNPKFLGYRFFIKNIFILIFK